MLFTAGISAPYSAWATPPPNDREIKSAVVQLLGKKYFTAACHLLDKNYPKGSEDSGALFLKARCKIGLRDYKSAVSLYRQIVKMSPDSSRAKEELAKAQILLDAEKKKGRNWFAEVTTGVVIDSNINSGPQSDQILVDGTPITLTGDSGNPVDALGYNVSGFAGYIHSLDATSALVARVIADRTAYLSPSEYDFDTFSTGIGYSKTLSKKNRLFIMPGVTWQALGGATYKTSADMSLRLTSKLDAKNTISASIAGSGNNYRNGGRVRSGFNFTLSPQYTRQINDLLSWDLALLARIENTKSSIDSYQSYGFRTGLDFKPLPTLSTNLSYQRTRKVHDAPDVFFSPEARKDLQSVISAGFSWDISKHTAENIKLNLKQQYIDNDSNISLNSLKRYITTISITKSW